MSSNLWYTADQKHFCRNACPCATGCATHSVRQGRGQQRSHGLRTAGGHGHLNVPRVDASSNAPGRPRDGDPRFSTTVSGASLGVNCPQTRKSSQTTPAAQEQHIYASAIVMTRTTACFGLSSIRDRKMSSTPQPITRVGDLNKTLPLRADRTSDRRSVQLRGRTECPNRVTGVAGS